MTDPTTRAADEAEALAPTVPDVSWQWEQDEQMQPRDRFGGEQTHLQHPPKLPKGDKPA